MSTTDAPTPEPENEPGISAERSAEVTTEEGTTVAHAEQTSVTPAPEAEEENADE